MNKLKKFFLNIWYGLPFGIKAADLEISGGRSDGTLGTEIIQEAQDGRVSRHLLKGEVTQEVEELRYRTYAVSNESEKYRYLGGGVAVKDSEKVSDREKKRHKFTQENENICESVLKSLQQVGNYGVEKYRFEMDYSSIVRFKIEKFATKVDVNIDDDSGIVETTFHFNSQPNPYDQTSKPFINELSKLKGLTNEYAISVNEIASSIRNFSFTTYRASNEDDLVSYSFMNGAKFKGAEMSGHEYLVKYSWDEYIRLPINLEAKYYSRSMHDKYKSKKRKDTAIPLVESDRKRYCSICGKEMSVYDADIQAADGDEIVCKECMKMIR